MMSMKRDQCEMVQLLRLVSNLNHSHPTASPHRKFCIPVVVWCLWDVQSRRLQQQWAVEQMRRWLTRKCLGLGM